MDPAAVTVAQIVVPRFAGGLVIGVAVVGAIAALIVGDTLVRVAVAVVVVAVVAVLLSLVVLQRRQGRSASSVRLELGGDTIDLAGVSQEEQERLIRQFLARQGVEASPEDQKQMVSEIRTAREGDTHELSVGGSGYTLTPVAPRSREVPYWLQVASPFVGMVTGIGGMLIALAK
jgi:hypothetical protein